MKSKTILITGGTSGIGLALAKEVLKQGNEVIITGRDAQKLDKISTELGIKSYLADSSNLEQLEQLGKSLIGDGILLDGVVLNAGVFYPSSFEEMSPEIYDKTMAINTRGPFFTLQALLPSLKNPASVVFTSSIVVNKGFPGCSVYAASKAAFESTVRVLNIELAERGIRINIFRPGITETEIHTKAGMDKEKQQATFDSLKSTPLARSLKSEDHIGTIIYLLGENSIPLRNAIIDIDGGFTL